MLMRRMMKERDGAQLQLESTVAFWMERVAEIMPSSNGTNGSGGS